MCTPNRILLLVVVVVVVCLPPPPPPNKIDFRPSHPRGSALDPVEHYTRFLHKNPAPPALELKKGKVKSASRLEQRKEEGAPRLSIERDDDDDELIDWLIDDARVEEL